MDVRPGVWLCWLAVLPVFADTPRDSGAPPPPPHGRLTVQGEDLVWEDGTPARFWGVNCVDELGREYGEIEQIARRIRQMGFNAVRLHLYDMRLLDPDATDAAGRPTSLVPRTATKGDDSVLDRFDYFLYCLEREGLYAYLTFDRQRLPYRPGDYDVLAPGDDADAAAWREAVAEYGGEHLVYVDPRIAEAQRHYARVQLNHVNLYTGRRIAEDPYVVLYELTNENRFVPAVLEGAPRTWPPYFQGVWQRRWNDWLRQRYGGDEALRAAWGALGRDEALADGTIRYEPLLDRRADYSSGRFADVRRFVYEAFVSFSQSMVEVIREAGCTAPVSFDTVFEHKHPWYYAVSPADVVCVGTYVNQVTAEQDAPERPFFSHLRRPPAFYNLDFATVAGKPTVVYEVNILKPARYRAEFPWLIASHAAWQGWDAVFWYVWSDGTVKDQHDPRTYLDTGLRYAATSHVWHGIVIATDEILLASLRAAGTAFLNGHLPVAPDPLIVTVGAEDLFGGNLWIGDIDLPIPEDAEGKYRRAAAQSATAQRRGLRFRYDPETVDTGAPEPLDGRLSCPLVRDGVRYDWEQGTLTIDRPGVKLHAGRREDIRFADGTSLTGVDREYTVFALVSQTPEPLETTQSAVMTLLSTGENTDVQFDLTQLDQTGEHPLYARLTRSWGRGPAAIDRVSARIDPAGRWRWTALDFLLRPVKDGAGAIPLTREDAVFVLELARP